MSIKKMYNFNKYYFLQINFIYDLIYKNLRASIFFIIIFLKKTYNPAFLQHTRYYLKYKES